MTNNNFITKKLDSGSTIIIAEVIGANCWIYIADSGFELLKISIVVISSISV